MHSVKSVTGMSWFQKIAILLTISSILIIFTNHDGIGVRQKWVKIVSTTKLQSLDKKWVKDDTEQDDPELVKFVRENYIIPPNKLPYAFVGSLDGIFSHGQLQSILHLLRKDSGGFYIEAGANDGEWGTNTFYLERHYGWNGLLVEASPATYQKLRKKNRKAWHSNAALSSKPRPMTATFYENPANSLIGGLTYRFYQKNEQKVEVQCIPFYTFLLAINRTEVDFFSLDLEGSELDVLRTVPWDKVNIKILAVEAINGKGGLEPVKKLMAKNGYHLHAVIPGLDDLIFINEEMFQLNQKMEKENRTKTIF